MRMKFTFKSLLLAAGLLVGSVNANAVEVTEFYDFQTWTTENAELTQSAIKITNALDTVLTVSSSVTIGGEEHNLNNRFAFCHYSSANGSYGWRIRRDDTNAYQNGLYTQGNSNTNWGPFYWSICDLKEGDKVTITWQIRSGKTAEPYFVSTNAKKDDVQVSTSDIMLSGTTYIITANGNLDLVQNDNNCAIKTVTIVTTGSEGIDVEPAISISGANNGDREITIIGANTNAGNPTVTYYTIDGTEPSSNSTEYTKPFNITTADDTDSDGIVIVKAIAYKEGDLSVVSSIKTLNVEVGQTLSLAEPIISRTASDKVTITASQTNVIGKPTAKIYYSYGENKDVEYTGDITITTDGVITAYATADGYAQSVESSREVALFPANIQVEDTPTKPSGWAASKLSEETIQTDKATYASLLLDDVQWGTNVYLQTEGWGYRNNGSWYTISAANVWMMMQSMKAGDIIVVDIDRMATATSNVEYSEKYTIGTKYAYVVTADGNAEIAFQRVANSVNNYFRGVYAYTTSTSVEISPAGYSTFSSEYAVTIPEGLTAYIATTTDVNEEYEGTITLQEVTGTVAANTGLLLKGDAGETYQLPLVAEEGESYEGVNLLQPTAADGNVAEGNYIFAYNNTNASECGFYYLESEVEVGAGKAYLAPEVAGINVLRFAFGDGTATAIEAPAAEAEAEGAVYNVAGQQVGSDYKGIVIKNGKKYLNK